MSKWKSCVTSQVARQQQHWDTGLAASYDPEKIQRAAADGVTSVSARMTKSFSIVTVYLVGNNINAIIQKVIC
jgi:hypothetical protein